MHAEGAGSNPQHLPFKVLKWQVMWKVVGSRKYYCRWTSVLYVNIKATSHVQLGL